MASINREQLEEFANLVFFKKANQAGTAYLVGGCVRDLLLQKESKDFDVEVYGLEPNELREVLEMFAGKYGLKVNTVGAAFTVYKVGENLDVSLPRREKKVGRGHCGFVVEGDPHMTCEEAASRRDFTINAMMQDLRTGEILDFFGGQEAIANKILRHINPKAFVEDSLRVLRAARFAANLGFQIDVATTALCNSVDLSDLPAERVWGELEKILMGGKPADGLFWLEMLGVTRKLFPEVHALIGVEQEPEWHPEGTVDVHTAQVVTVAEEISRHLPYEKRLTVILAALCHDFGKATTTEFLDGRWRALGHADAGVEPTVNFLQRLKVHSVNGFKVSEVVPLLVKHHLAPFELHRTQAKTNVKGAIRRLANKVDLELLYYVNKSDALGRYSPFSEKLPDAEASEWFREQYSQMEIEVDQKIPRIFTGKHLISLGIKPGKQFGELLDDVYNKQLDGMLTNFEEAERYAKSLIEEYNV